MRRSLKFTTTLFALIIYYGAFSQQPQWFIKNLTEENTKILNFRDPGGVSIDPNSLAVDPDYSWVYNFKEGHNAIYDDNGDLKIVITNNEIFSADGTYLYTLLNSSYDIFHDYSDPYYQYDHDLAVVPVPGNCDRYYIFRYSLNGHGSSSNLLHYYIFDVALNALINEETGDAYPIEDWVPGKFLFSASVPKRIVNELRNLSVSKMNNDGDRFLFFEDLLDYTFSTGPFRIHKVKITSTGVTYEGVEYVSPHVTVSKTHETEVIQLPSGDYLYATCLYLGYGYAPKGMIFYMDSAGSIISESEFSIPGKIKGMEFSPNGEYLYFTQTEAPFLQYVEVASPGIVLDLAPTFMTPEENGYYNVHKKDYKFSSIEVAHNGKMYYAGTLGFSSLEDPNDPTSIWVNNEISVVADELTRGFTYSESERLIPLPVQVDGELIFKPITWPTTVSTCGSSFDEICLEDYPGFSYEWYLWGGLVGEGNCFTPTSSGSYTIVVTDENGCVKEHNFSALFHMPLIPAIPDVSFCYSENEPAPEFIGWETHPLLTYECIYAIHWYYNDIYLPEYDNQYEIPFMGEGIYCAKILLGETIITRCFDAYECCVPNPDFSAELDLVNNPFVIEINNYPIYTGAYDSELFMLYKDCDGDDFIGPWEYVETISRTSGFDEPVFFDILIPNCLYKIVHAVSSDCLMASYVHTEYVGWLFGAPSAMEIETGNTIEESELRMTVYPNPTKGQFVIDFQDGEINGSVEILDVLGKVIYFNKVKDSSQISIDISNKPEGVYFVNVWFRGKLTSKKMVINPFAFKN